MHTASVLIVGAGKIAERHMKAWRELTTGDIGVYDVASDRAQAMARTLAGLHVTDSGEAISSDQYSIVDVCVPTPYHCEYVLQALAARRHVFVEKPLCLARAEAEEIVAAAERADRHVQVGYLLRHYPAFIQVAKWVAASLIGPLYLVMTRMGGRGSAAAWKHRRADGGGAVNEMVVHKLDLLMWFLGELHLVAVHVRDTLVPTREIGGVDCVADAEDFVLAEFRSGATRVFLQSDLVTPTYMENIELHGSNGSIVASVQEGFRNFVYLKEGRGDMEAGYHYRQFEQTNLFEAELRDFLERLHETPCHNGLREAAAQVEILEQMRNSG